MCVILSKMCIELLTLALSLPGQHAGAVLPCGAFQAVADCYGHAGHMASIRRTTAGCKVLWCIVITRIHAGWAASERLQEGLDGLIDDGRLFGHGKVPGLV